MFLSLIDIAFFAQFQVGLELLKLLLFVSSLWLIFLILIQRGKGGGLSAALGGGGGDSAFGAKAGDAFTKITVISALVWIGLCMVTIARYNPPERATNRFLEDDEYSEEDAADMPVVPPSMGAVGGEASDGAEGDAASGSATTDGGLEPAGGTDGASSDEASSDGASVDGASTDAPAESSTEASGEPADDQ